jgi:hypothetical protein
LRHDEQDALVGAQNAAGLYTTQRWSDAHSELLTENRSWPSCSTLAGGCLTCCHRPHSCTHSRGAVGWAATTCFPCKHDGSPNAGCFGCRAAAVTDRGSSYGAHVGLLTEKPAEPSYSTLPGECLRCCCRSAACIHIQQIARGHQMGRYNMLSELHSVLLQHHASCR